MRALWDVTLVTKGSEALSPELLLSRSTLFKVVHKHKLSLSKLLNSHHVCQSDVKLVL